MNILHLLSQNQLTGAEVYAVTLARNQIEQGHQVYQLSNGFYYPSPAVNLKLEVETKSKFIFLKNILWLRNFIRKQNIHVVHSHSRAAAKLAYWAVLFSKTAQISTVHGIQHASFSKKIHNQYGEFIIAVCENLKKHLISDFSYRSSRIKTIPNPVLNSDFYFIPSNRQTPSLKKIAIVGRTTGPKQQRTEQLLKALSPEVYEITLIGGYLNELNIDSSLKAKIKEIKTIGLNSQTYADYDLIIGSGRVCIESLITGVPTIAFGEACYIGRITENNFNEACGSNFGDIHPFSKTPNLDVNKFSQDLQSVTVDTLKLSELAANEFSSYPIAAKIQRLYESAYFLKNHPRWIPILMYHKIPDREIKSRHKIFVTKENFEKHLKYFSQRGFKTLTFSDLHKFRTGEKSFADFPKKPLILTFDDGYLDNLENASPLLKQYNFKAQLFLLADSQINQNTWDINSEEPAHEIISGPERLKWKNSAFEIGSHGFSHKKITEFSSAAALNELLQSKKSLEKEFDQPIRVYAFTYGISTPEAAQLAQAAGYEYAVNTDSGGILIEEDPYSIFRVSLFPDESRLSLFKKTSTWYRKYYFLKRKK